MRIGVKNGGCAGMEYTMSYAEARGPHDEVIEDKGVKLLIDPTAVMFLLGTEMDYRADRMRSGFVFNNPNQTVRLRLRRVGFAQARRSPRERRPSSQALRHAGLAGIHFDGAKRGWPDEPCRHED